MNNLATKNQQDYTITPAGEAFVSQRKAAEMCGVDQSTLSELNAKLNNYVKLGLKPDILSFCITHYATKGHPEAVAMLVKFARAGEKAYIMHEAGFITKAEWPATVPENCADELQLEADRQRKIQLDAPRVAFADYEIEKRPTNVPENYADALQLAADQQRKIQLDAPKVAFADYVIGDGTSLLVGDYAKLLSDQHRVHIGPNKLMAWLRSAGFLMTGVNGHNRNIPYQKYIDSGWFVVKHQYIEAQGKSFPTSYVTGSGQVHLSERIVSQFRAK